MIEIGRRYVYGNEMDEEREAVVGHGLSSSNCEMVPYVVSLDVTVLMSMLSYALQTLGADGVRCWWW